jgi:hypothetical protein
MSAPESLRRRTGQLAGLTLRHPLVSVGVFAAAVAVSQVWWVARHRVVGAFDVDESGYLAMALRYHRLLAEDPAALWDALRATETAPLVPFLSATLLLVGPPSTTAAFAMLAVLTVVAAVAVAGVALRLSGPVPALVAGALSATLPVTMASGRLYQFSLAAAAFTLLGLLGLLSSERGERLAPMLLGGAAFGLALLSRTMMLGLLPAVAVAALVLCSRSRRAWTNLALAALTMLLVAAPWYLSSWRSVSAYLFRSGYGDRSELWGETELFPRLGLRALITMRDGRLVAVAGAVLVAVAIQQLWSWRRSGEQLRRWPPMTRPIAACVLFVVVAYVALLSTPNTGSGFDLPVQLVALGTGVAVASRLITSPRVARGAAVAAVALAVAVVPLSWVDDGTEPSGIGPILAFAVVGGSIEHQADNLAADPRLGSTDRRAAAAEWSAANDAVVDELDALSRRYGDTTATVTGAGHLFNGNTLGLSAELRGRGLTSIDVPDTTAPADARLRDHLDPVADSATAGESRGSYRTAPSRRVLVVIDNRSTTFPDDRDVPRFVALAEAEGWVPGASVPLPDGGDVTVWTHPDNAV